MKKISVLLFAVLVLGLAGCRSAPKSSDEASWHVPSGPVYTGYTPPQGSSIVVGESSNTVENLGKQQGCSTTQGASLLTSDGPVETYRMQCTNGRVFTARCEYRRCSQLQ